MTWLRWMTWLLRALTCVTVFAAPLEGYLLQVHGQSAKVAPGLLVVVWAVVRVRQRRALEFRALHGILALLAIVLLISAAVHAGGVYTADYALRWLPFLVLTVVLTDVVAREVSVRAVLAAAVAGAVVAAGGALWTLAVGGGTRAAGPLEDPNDLAYFLVAALPLLVGLRGRWSAESVGGTSRVGARRGERSAEAGRGVSRGVVTSRGELGRGVSRVVAARPGERSAEFGGGLSRGVVASCGEGALWGGSWGTALGEGRMARALRGVSRVVRGERPVGSFAVSRVVIAVAGTVLVVGAAATFSRGGALAAAGAAGWLLVRRAVPLKALVGGVLAVAVLGVAAVVFAGPALDRAVQEKTFIAGTNVDTRELRWQAAARMLADHPALGVGPGGFRAGYPAASHNAEVDEQTPVAHNMYLEVAAELGLPGFALFAALLVLTATTSERVRRATDDPLPVVAVQASLIAVLVASTFLSEQYYLPLWSLVAVVAAADLRLRRTSDVACAPRDQ